MLLKFFLLFLALFVCPHQSLKNSFLLERSIRKEFRTKKYFRIALYFLGLESTIFKGTLGPISGRWYLGTTTRVLGILTAVWMYFHTVGKILIMLIILRTVVLNHMVKRG